MKNGANSDRLETARDSSESASQLDNSRTRREDFLAHLHSKAQAGLGQGKEREPGLR